MKMRVKMRREENNEEEIPLTQAPHAQSSSSSICNPFNSPNARNATSIPSASFSLTILFTLLFPNFNTRIKASPLDRILLSYIATSPGASSSNVARGARAKNAFSSESDDSRSGQGRRSLFLAA